MYREAEDCCFALSALLGSDISHVCRWHWWNIFGIMQYLFSTGQCCVVSWYILLMVLPMYRSSSLESAAVWPGLCAPFYPQAENIASRLNRSSPSIAFKCRCFYMPSMVIVHNRTTSDLVCPRNHSQSTSFTKSTEQTGSWTTVHDSSPFRSSVYYVGLLVF